MAKRKTSTQSGGDEVTAHAVIPAEEVALARELAAQPLPAVMGEAGLQVAGAELVRRRRLRKALEGRFDGIKRPFLDGLKRLREFEAELVGALKRTEEALVGLIEGEQRRLSEARRAEAEAAAQAARQAEVEILQRVAEQTGSVSLAEQAAAVQKAPVYVPAAAPVTIDGLQQRETWDVEVYDLARLRQAAAAQLLLLGVTQLPETPTRQVIVGFLSSLTGHGQPLPPQALAVDTAALRAHARELQSEVEWPGARTVKRFAVALRPGL